VEEVVRKENAEGLISPTLTSTAIKMLADAASGSVRDALSYLETVLGYKPEGEITETDVAQILGSVAGDVLEELIAAIQKKDIAKISALVDTIFSKGINAAMLVKNFLDIIKGHLLKEPAKYGNVFKIFSELEINIKNSQDVRTYFENTCLLAAV
jgi:DNA polymerase III gamma/tau subunit